MKERLLYENGEQVQRGDIIQWNVYDFDDYATYQFRGLVCDSFVVYLGGGIDFGTAIGKQTSFEEVYEEVINNDEGQNTIEKITDLGQF